MDQAQTTATQSQRGSKNRRAYIVLAILIVLAAGGVGVAKYFHRDAGPITKNIRQSVNFALYYPTPLPSGYVLDKGSVKTANKVVFYTLKNDSQTITVSQQPAPSQPPDLDALQRSNTSFKSIDTNAGRAIIGTNPQSKSIVAILATNTTLISITGSKSVPRDVIAKATQNMSSLPQ